MADRNMRKLPSVGYTADKIWDEKGRTEIVQIIVTYDECRVHSLQFLYSEEGNLVLSDLFGHNYGPDFQIVKFNYPSEYITCVSGLYYYEVVSIKFTTNLGTYGPFGCTADWEYEDYRFSFGAERVFGGFHGSADPDGHYGIASIGVYVKLPTTLNGVDQNAVPVSRRNSKVKNEECDAVPVSRRNSKVKNEECVKNEERDSRRNSKVKNEECDGVPVSRRNSKVKNEECDVVPVSGRNSKVRSEECDVVPVSRRNSKVKNEECDVILVSWRNSKVKNEECDVVPVSGRNSKVKNEECDAVLVSRRNSKVKNEECVILE